MGQLTPADCQGHLHCRGSWAGSAGQPDSKENLLTPLPLLEAVIRMPNDREQQMLVAPAVL